MLICVSEFVGVEDILKVQLLTMAAAKQLRKK